MGLTDSIMQTQIDIARCGQSPCPSTSTASTSTPLIEASLSEFFGALIGVMTPAAGADDVAPASGGATISAADFNSTARPGICKATNVTALNYVKELQRQLNRVASVKGLSTIAIDGEVGPSTIAAWNKAQTASGGKLGFGTMSSCLNLAPDADVLSDVVKTYADSIGAPATVSAPFSAKPVTIISKDGKEKIAAGLLDTFGRLPTLEKVAVVGVFGGIGYLLLTGKKRRKK